MNFPIDIKAVLDAMGANEQARSMPIRVHVYLGSSAPDDLVNAAIAATKTSAPHATVRYDAYPPQHALPDAAADMALLVAGTSDETGRLYADLHAVGVPAAVLCTDGAALIDNARSLGTPIAQEDVVSADKRNRPSSPEGDDSSFVLGAQDAASLFYRLGEWITGTFKEKRLAFAYAFACVRRPLALESVNNTAVQNAGIGVVAIIPGADLPLMTLNQVKMLLEMAAAFGEELSLGRLKEICAIVGGAFVCRAVSRQVAGLVPGVGWAVKGGIGYVGTQAMGHALLDYFESGADAARYAASLGQKVKLATANAGVSPQRPLVENAASIVEAAGEAATRLGGSFLPTVGSVATAAVKATGLTKSDINGLAAKALGALRRENRKAVLCANGE